MRVSDVDPGSVTTRTIAFVLGPRLNAAGRMDEATVALELLLAPDMAAALPLAEQLEDLNAQRREIGLEVRSRVRDMVMSGGDLRPLIFAASANFTVGVVGPAASRLVDEFYRPSVVVAVEGEQSKGSARSIPEFDITAALDTMSDLLVRHGGHAAAAGFTVRTSDLGELEARLDALAESQLGDRLLVPTLQIDAAVPLHDMSWEVARELDNLRPFGFGNPVPVFASTNLRVLRPRAVGADGQHLKLAVVDDNGKLWDAIAFRQGHWIGRVPQRVDLAYQLEVNEWNGRTSLQLNVQDIQVPNGRGSDF
jgi:single-stranded-DNA-specific exonuclease